MKRQILVLALVLSPLMSVAQTDNASDADALKRLGTFASNMIAYNNMYTQEKVYLHFDNDGYLPGEKIWFKAYVFKASTLLPTDMSKVLYVELLNPYGQVMERRTLPVTNGRTYGDFQLDPLIVQPGYYEVRAYTRAMLNWDEAYIFSRVMPVYEEPADTVNFTDLEVGETDFYYRGSNLVRSEPQPLTDQTTQRKGSTMVTFYPEGGNITTGQPARVAFKMTDKEGNPISDSLTVYGQDGSVVAQTKPLHLGMGSFRLPDNWQGGYATVDGAKNAQFELPQQRSEGCDIEVVTNQEGDMVVRLHASASVRDHLLGLSVTCRGQLCFFSDVTPAKNDSVTIPVARLREGVHQITLFTPDGEIMSERLAWAAPRQEQPTMVVNQNQEAYEAFSPVVLDIELKDADGQPLQADFSLSVRDADTQKGRPEHSMRAEMLLASELKGYIHNPDFYFLAPSETSPATIQHREQALDLLLMVQGWRRYSWREMAGLDTFQLKQPAEDGLLLYGNITSTSAAQKALKNYDKLSINFMVTTDQGMKTFFADTDSEGRFAVQLPDFYGDASSVITVTNLKDKRVYTDLKINRNFSPAVIPYEPIALPKDNETTSLTTLSKPVSTFQWTDTIPDLISKVINLQAVQIKQKRTSYGFKPSLRSLWKGGENAVRKHSTFYYNILEELDKYMDEGNGVPQIWEWLTTVNPYFEYHPADSSMYYRGGEVVVILDHDQTEKGRLGMQSTGLMNEYRTMIIVEDLEDARRILLYSTGEDTTFYDKQAVIFHFTREVMPANTSFKKGTRFLTLHGYSRCDEFYSPDYRLSDIPTATDHRRTLYWNPSLITDPQGKADVLFYSNSRERQRLQISVQGIAVNGQMFEVR